MTNSAAITTGIDLPQLGLLHIAGADAKKFLQGQITCNVNDVTATQSRLGAHCNPQGRIITLFRLFTFQENVYLQMPVELLAPTLAALQKYAVFFKVNLQIATETLTRIGYAGTALEKIFPHLPSTSDDILSEKDICILRLAGTEPRYEILGEANTINEIKSQLHITPRPDPMNTWKYWNISTGIPTIYSATVGKFLPHELNLQLLNGISFDKGCYTGQEIIARMHYRGQLKKKMCQARVKTITCPTPGSDIYLDSPAGTVVDSCRENAEHCLLLVVCDEQTMQREALYLDPHKTQPLEFISLPSGNNHV